ncbi:helix-turn-helix transcriptional regulator [Arcanobacterium pinnipediorum]|uniref:WYL domain-containing protein n=1 Tax=Arcanobacterium pinnipediorum TaxID=1503041 RepID=A0ABY5AGL3_9ACTO|nr:WYL domain-containing protein [Arcanobacterium pinnipediorum]USR78631.1 WYL domain-containing protein [Arcanobacterium pinnipediorum]
MGFGDLSLARKRAIAEFLQSESGVTLGELAHRFGTSWEVMRAEIEQLSTVELISGSFFDTPFDIWIADEEPDADSFVYAADMSENSSLTLSLAEIVSLLGATDIAMLSADRDDGQALVAFRERVVAATADAGYESVLWPAPQLQAPPEVLDILSCALTQRCSVHIEYWKNVTGRLERSEIEVQPVSLSYVPYPLLIAANDVGDVRRYRFDRITRARLGTGSVSARLVRNVSSQANASDKVEGKRIRLVCGPGARWVCEEVPDALLVGVDGDFDIIELPVRSHQWLFSLLVRLGEIVQRVEPVEG